MRGVREINLDGLRKRISTLFLQYIKTPTFNPESAKLLKVNMLLVMNITIWIPMLASQISISSVFAMCI